MKEKTEEDFNDKFLIDASDNNAIKNVIINGVRDFNKPFFGNYAVLSFTIYCQDNQKEIIAGIVGKFFNNYAKLDWVWIDKNHRQKGLGRKLFKKCEEYLKEKGVKIIHLDTFDFQARPFYEKIGFHCAGTISKWLEGHDCHFMMKEI